MKYTPEQIEERFDQLPDDIKEAISSVDTTDLILKIGDDKKLHVDQIGDLVDETGLVMLGMTRSEDFVKSVSDRLGVSTSVAQELVNEIDNKVLAKLRDSIKSLFEEKKAAEEIEEVSVKKVDPYREMSAESDELERERILREIENPEEIGKTPVKSEIPVAVSTPAPAVEVKKPEPVVIMSTPVVTPVTSVAQKPVEIISPEALKDQVTKGEEIIPYDEDARDLGEVKEVSLMEKKLTETTKAPVVEEKKIIPPTEDKKVVVPPAPAVEGGDPYRELV